jgi:hypothetical protein
MATWIIVGAAVVVALIVGGVILVAFLATRTKAKPTRIPGLSRMIDQAVDPESAPPGGVTAAPAPRGGLEPPTSGSKGQRSAN